MSFFKSKEVFSKKILIAFLVGVGTLFFACNGSQQKNQKDSTAVADSQAIMQKEAEEMKAGKALKEAEQLESSGPGIGPYTSFVLKTDTIDREMAARGKEIFQDACAPCHEPSNKIDVGPGLKGITQMRSPAWIMNMIANPEEMVEKDPIAKQLKEQLGGAEMKVPVELDQKMIRDILEYLRENDA